MIDGSGTINPAALNTPGNFPSSQSPSLGHRLAFALLLATAAKAVDYRLLDKSYVELLCVGVA